MESSLFTMPELSRLSLDRLHWIKTLIWGFFAGVLAGIAMLLTMALLRLFLGWLLARRAAQPLP